MSTESTISHERRNPGQTVAQRAGDWLQDPMGSVIAASAATIGSFGIVLSGTWFIHLALH